MTSAMKMTAITKTRADPRSSQTLLEPFADCGRRGLGQRTGLHAQQSIHEAGVRTHRLHGNGRSGSRGSRRRARLPRREGGRGGPGRLQSGDAASRRAPPRGGGGGGCGRRARGDRRARLARRRAAAGRSPRRWLPRTWCWRPRSSRSRTRPPASAATEAGARCATLPGVTEEMLARVMSADMEGLRRKGHAVADALDARLRGADHRLPTAPTSASISPAGRRSPTPASSPSPAPSATCPAARASSRPAGGEGTLVVDGSIAGIGLVDEPVELVVEGGHLTSARGGQGMAFMELLTVHGEDGTNIAELGIGTNEKAILTGEILEDEKILGTCPRRLRRLRRHRGHRPGAGPPRLRRDEADGRARRRGDRPRRRAADPVNDASPPSTGPCRCSPSPTSPRAAASG